MFNNQELTTEVSGLKNFARRLTQNNHDAEDLLQYTLLRAIEKKHLFQENTDLFKWTSKIMYNQFVSDYRRKAKFETKYDPESYLEAESIEAPQDKQIELQSVNEAMSRLSHEHQEILILICVQGMSYQEVSEFLNIAIGTVRSRLSRARENLQQQLETTAAN
ncbi:sigma-70 family RNA polymerase sigma factor [Sneathiella litorea]|uniref:Sigma-70 family RNA polymerase sigma factor n=1 Tax=Sneathiella litorea TaxID=2606216 RepID=A0A6L8W6C9_9PROT|nr:sigma-70 family RNA polymerase sigma factor [Sneathiella litorea]MZR30053.1 sigma-70 family RNA polymerase sigma factor [Sneathiella litorea]